jgi:hypothetical protein
MGNFCSYLGRLVNPTSEPIPSKKPSQKKIAKRLRDLEKKRSKVETQKRNVYNEEMHKYACVEKNAPFYFVLPPNEIIEVEGQFDRRREQRFVIAINMQSIITIRFSESNVFPDTCDKYGVPAVTLCPFLTNSDYFYLIRRSHDDGSLSFSPLDKDRLMIFQSGHLKSVFEQYTPENIRRKYGKIRAISFRKNGLFGIHVTIVDELSVEHVEEFDYPESSNLKATMPFPNSKFQLPPIYQTDINLQTESEKMSTYLRQIASNFDVIRFSIRVFNGQTVTVEVQ